MLKARVASGVAFALAMAGGCSDDGPATASDGSTGGESTTTTTATSTATTTTDDPGTGTGTTGGGTTSAESSSGSPETGSTGSRGSTGSGSTGSSSGSGESTGTSGSTGSSSGSSTSGEPNTPPFISEIDNLSVLEDEASGALSFAIGDDESGLGALMLSVTSSDEVLIPSANIVLGGTGPVRTVDFTPAPDRFGGPVTITVTVDDGTETTDETFDVTVTPVNDAPSFTGGADVSVAIDAGAQQVAGWATGMSAGPFEDAQGYTFVVTAADSRRFSTVPAVAEDGELSFGFASGRVGPTTVTVLLVDDGGTDNGGVDTSAEYTLTLESQCGGPPPPADYFVGSYLMEQLTGADPLFGGETFGDNQVVNIAPGNAYERSFDFLYYPGIFDGDYNFTMTFCEGEVFVAGTINDGTLGCGSNLGFGTGVPASTYDLMQDALVPVGVTDFEPTGSCDESPYQVALQFTADP